MGMTPYAAIAALLCSAAAHAAVPLPPIGKWGLDQQPDKCVLEHSFGAEGAERKLAIIPHPGLNTELLLVLPPDVPIAKGKSDGKVVLLPSGKSYSESVETIDLGGGISAFSMRIDPAALEVLPTETQMDVSIKSGVDLSLTLPTMKAATSALETCLQDMAARMGVAPGVIRNRQINRASRAKQLDHIGYDAYPDGAEGASGEATSLLTIGTDGKVTDCRITKSSGNAALDERSCQLQMRFRFPPEHDASGKAVTSWTFGAMIWHGR